MSTKIKHPVFLIWIKFVDRGVDVKNILFIKIGALGDLSYAFPAAQALKNSQPCHITWLAGKTYASFLRGHAHIDKLVLVDDKKLYSTHWWTRAWELLKLAVKLHRRFDQVIIAHRDPIYYHAFNIFSRGATFQMVRDNKNSPQFVYIPPMQLHESLAIKKLVIAAANFFNPALRDVKWQWDYSHIPRTNLILPPNYAVLHLGGGVNAKTEFKLKCWPHWDSLVMRLLTETDLNLVFVGSSAEEINYKEIVEKIRLTSPERLHRCFNFMKGLSIVDMVDVIRRAEIFAGVDSGPLHIADSLNKKVIGLYGPTSVVSWGLLSSGASVFHNAVECSPCYKDDAFFPPCNHQHKCMQGLEVSPVLEKIKQLTTTVETVKD
jgi:ADP-heptose:LPS heptosyltransferase